MEKLDVFDCSNVFVASYFTDDRGCAHCCREHTLLYLESGELEITDNGRKTILHAGDCAFLRRDNRMWLQKRVKPGVPYRSFTLKFSREFLRDAYRRLTPDGTAQKATRSKQSLVLLPSDRPDLHSLFLSVKPYFEAGVHPSDEILRLKMAEGLYALLNTAPDMYASLFDFVDPWKIDIMDFMERNYRNDELSMEDMAYYTGRSLSTFKRDFKKYTDLTPEKWLIRRRLEAARELIRSTDRKVSEICFDVGFKNLSHFSKAYKKAYGVAPALCRT